MTPEEWAGQLKTQKTKLSRARLQGIEKVLAENGMEVPAVTVPG